MRWGLCVMAVWAGSVWADDWPVFLGPDGNGVSSETGLLTRFSESGPDLLWKRDIGSGYSAPSVVGESVVIFHRLGNEETVECLDVATGETVWASRYESSFRDPYGYNNGPRTSPLIDKRHDPNRVFTFGAEGVLRCLRLDNGELLWERNTGEEFDVPRAFFGVGATPILVDGMLVVPVGGQPNAGLVGVDPDTGKTRWAAVGKETWDGAETGWSREPTYQWTGGEMVMSYSSPLAATFHDRTHVLCLTRQGLVSVDPQTGTENFHYWFRSPKHESVNAARPVVVDDTIFLSSTYGTGAVKLRVRPDGRSLDVVWKVDDRFETHWSTAIYHDGHYYGFSARHERDGQMVCLNAETGDVRWSSDGWNRPLNELKPLGPSSFADKTTGEPIPWPFYGRGSATLADGHFYVLAERGTLAIVKADAVKWQETSRVTAPEMEYPAWPAPVIANGRMYLRDEDSLVCLDMRSKE